MSGEIALSVQPGNELFPLSTDTLAKLVDPKSPDLYKELGGLNGISTALRADVKRGLPSAIDSEEEQKRIEKYARNVLPEPPRETFMQLVWAALQDKVLLLLIGAAVISIILGSMPWTSPEPEIGWIDGVAILIAVVIVVSVTSGNDFQKQKQFRKLDAKKNDRQVKAIRDGDQQQISIFDVKAGDVVILDTGDIICADGIFIEGHALKCDESALTGESDPIKKGPVEEGFDPFLISGSLVLEGVGKMLVFAVGVHSFNGRTMMSLRVPDEETPLQNKLEHLASNIGKFGLGAAILLLLIGIPKYFITAAVAGTDMGSEDFKKHVGADMVRLVINAITIVVVAVPEGLPLAVTIALAYGMMKMLKDNNLVRHLAACETMGGATNICSDKTGTLTQNLMTVVTGWIGGKRFPEINESLRTLPKDIAEALCEGIAVNSNAFEGLNHKGKMDFVGSKTECALLKFAKVCGYEYQEIRNRLPVFQLYPFSSARKRMSTVVKTPDGQYRIYTKGASEIILEMCNRIMIVPEGNPDRCEIRELDPALKEHIKSVITEYATDALRTIGLAFTEVSGVQNWDNPPEDNLIMLAIVGIRDPLRPEVPDAVATCQKAGITVRMVTGDNIVTAENIAKACGILKPGGICMEGPKFRDLPREEMDKIIPRLQVLARSSPTDKQLLVGRLKELGEVVAVTGDGTNDGPALKMADIGFSMGISGTEVAIAASDVVLLDDNFASIVKAALWGRNIFDAIRKFLQFQLTVNVVAVTIAFIGTLSGSHGESPLTAVQLLWVNLIMDSLAALALATEIPTPDLLDRKPVGRHAPLITRKMWRNIIGHSIYQLAINFALLYGGAGIFGVVPHSRHHYTIIFNTFVFMQLFNEINSRKLNDELNAFSGLFTNRLFGLILVITVVVQVVFVEVGDRFTSTSPLPWDHWLICIALGAIELPVQVIIRLVPIEERADDHSNEPRLLGDDDSDGAHLRSSGDSLKPIEVSPSSNGHPMSSSSSSSAMIAGHGHGHRRIRRWSMVREAVTKIAVINAFKVMKQYKVVQADS